MNQWILERILGYPIFRQSHMDSIEFMVFKRLITGFSMLILDIGWELAGLLDWVPPLETEISPWKDGHLDQKWWWKSRGTLIWGWRTYKFPGFHFDFLGILLAQMDIQTSKVGFDSHNSHLYHLYPLYLAIIERLTHKHWDSTKWNGSDPLKGERFHILSSISTWNGGLGSTVLPPKWIFKDEPPISSPVGYNGFLLGVLNLVSPVSPQHAVFESCGSKRNWLPIRSNHQWSWEVFHSATVHRPAASKRGQRRST